MTFRKNAQMVYQCAPFEALGFSHGFGTRQAPHPLAATLTLRQIHSAIVHAASGEMEDRSVRGDALVAGGLSRPVGVRTADCVPVLLCDPVTRSVAAIHAGWRGTVAEICRAAVSELQRIFDVKPDNLHAAIGPCIRRCCYEVSADVADQFADTFPQTLAEGRAEGKFMLDLPEANRAVLIAAGLRAERIYNSHLCTGCRLEEFFSYRKAPQETGRMVSAISTAANTE